MEVKNYAAICKALGDETRMQIVTILKNGDMCACKILEYFNITQPTLSYHMKSLTECGLVVVRKDGIWNHYSVNNELLENMAKYLLAKNNTTCCCEKNKNCK